MPVGDEFSATKLSPEEQDILTTFEKGRRLFETVNSAGWSDVLDLIEKRVLRAEFHLINYDGTDKDMLLALHRRARTMRETLTHLQSDIQAQIDASTQVPDIIHRSRVTVGTPGML